MLGVIHIKRLEFPGRAGELQRAGDNPGLVRELGGNYAVYHQFLRRALADLGGRPERSAYPDEHAYTDACDRAHDIVKAETLIRACRANVKHGKRLDTPLDVSVPLLDESYRLVPAE